MWEGAGGRRMDRHHPGSQAIGQIFGNWLPPALARQFSYFCGALFSHCVSFSLLLLLSLSLQKKEASVFPLQSGSPTQITARENTYMDKVRTE